MGFGGGVRGRQTGDLRLLLLTAICLMLGALGFAGCGDEGSDGDDGAAQETPRVADIPRGAVALVGDDPVTRRELAQRVAAVRRSQSRGSRPTLDQLRYQAMGLLLQQAALEQEAREHGLAVTRAEVDALLRRTRRQFPDRRSFERFLGERTRGDLRAQLRLQALAEKIDEEGGDDVGTSSGKLRERWAARTACREEYLVSACANAGK